MKLKYLSLALPAVLCTTSATFAQSGKTDQPQKFIDTQNMDTAVKPGDDFFEYANGGWVKHNEIPAKQTRWGSFIMLRQESTDKLISILDEVSKQSDNPKGSIKQRTGDLYASAMDSLAIEKKGYNPIKIDLKRIDKIASVQGVVNELVYERVNGLGSPLFGFGVGQDSKNPTKYIVSLGQGGTTLPDRDYYLKSDARSQKIQDAYKKYIIQLFTLTGTPADVAEKNAAIIWQAEKTLAAAQLSRVAMRDPNATYNKFTVAAFSKTTPNLNWVVLLPKLKTPGQDSMLVSNPAFMKTADSLLTATPLDDVKVYLKWNILKGAASSLSSPFVKASFDFNSVLSGQKVQAPRSERMSALVDGSLGELLGQLYVAKYFPPAAKQYMEKLVNNLKVAYAEHIKNLDWMSAATKDRALKKLNAFTVKIGYPDKWQTYDGLNISRNDYAGNLRNISVWRYNYMVTRLGKPVDKTRWGMTPPTVNAYYNSVNNEIVFPAGILRFPFFDFNADDAINYGGIGAVIGHEITHGFDDQGRKYDADGTLRDWWTAEDADKFKQRSDKVVEQYNALTVLDTMHVNGRLTLGENLADLGGLSIAYDAWKKTKQGQGGEKIDGFTPDQRFFLSWAQVWRSKQLAETAAQRILTDPHSPEEHRTNAPITNIDAWYKAFDVKPGDKMYKKPEDRARIW
ncbi:M13 family metallopeptidase [Mucilaginibacter sp. JRF]|uniref:M13 family metallopeptidase n=1 Tax=Mucilaginibacter sp. JRF TaxID=2780088 RepID=UPI00187ED24D|nr:M13 family metallopeptidase [Mucilaginibacter sp. JRF]MBE9585068.1 M13 family metallopeptidase [Mucilaginibacter sp. JRF]